MIRTFCAGNALTLIRGAFCGATALLFLALSAGAAAAATMSADRMYAQWAKSSQSFEGKHPPLPADSAEARWVGEVGNRIVASWPDRRWVTHSFIAVRDPEPGAWSFPISEVSHHVYVSTGLLDLIRTRGGERRDDLLAGVLGHELAHLMEGHYLLREKRAERLGLRAPKDLAQWPATVLAEWQQDDEYSADKYGAFMAMHAGYSFQGIVDFLALFRRVYGDYQDTNPVPGKPAEGHPLLNSRISHLREAGEEIASATRLYQCGLDFLRVGAWEEARASFLQVRNTFRLSPSVVHNQAYADLKAYEAALGSALPLEQSLSVSYLIDAAPKGPQGSAARERLDEAKDGFRKARDMDEDRGFVAPRVGLATVYLYEGEVASARATLGELQTGLEDPDYLNTLGVVEELSGQSGAARRDYSKALDLGPEASGEALTGALQRHPQPHLAALYNLARLLEAQGRPVEAALLYQRYLGLEGRHSHFGARALEGLLRCGGQPTPAATSELVGSYREIVLGESGPLVMEAALGKPERQERLRAAGLEALIYDYPTLGTKALLAPNAADDPVVVAIELYGPSAEPAAGVRPGETVARLERALGWPRQVAAGAASEEWWDYATRGMAVAVQDGRVSRILVGGRR